MAGEADAVLLICLAFIFPPAAVAFLAGCGADLCLNILLSLLGWLPGCIHAFWLILKRTEANETYGYGNWTYSGMGEYQPRTQRSPSGQPPGPAQPAPPPPPPPPPPPEQYPTEKKSQPTPAPVPPQTSEKVDGGQTGYPGPPPGDPTPPQTTAIPPSGT